MTNFYDSNEKDHCLISNFRLFQPILFLYHIDKVECWDYWFDLDCNPNFFYCNVFATYCIDSIVPGFAVLLQCFIPAKHWSKQILFLFSGLPISHFLIHIEMLWNKILGKKIEIFELAKTPVIFFGILYCTMLNVQLNSFVIGFTWHNLQ